MPATNQCRACLGMVRDRSFCARYGQQGVVCSGRCPGNPVRVMIDGEYLGCAWGFKAELPDLSMGMPLSRYDRLRGKGSIPFAI
jgi:hypothetical protein